MPAPYAKSVFINCPFDAAYRPLLDALVFAVMDSGCVARSAREISDGAENRLEKIFRIIEGCSYGIHDLSRTELHEQNQLPRFNMPFELGLFLACKRFGVKQGRKAGLILDRQPHRYQQFISDIAGQDIEAHDNDPSTAIRCVRNWLQTHRPKIAIPGGEAMAQRYAAFQAVLPAICEEKHVQPAELTFVDLGIAIHEWLVVNPVWVGA